ncbi:hypothetical protein ACFZAU_12140 [Streptomyces sp. NPDC008238]
MRTALGETAPAPSRSGRCSPRKGQHRAASIADLLIATTAERYRITVLHYDADFDTIAAVTNQAVRRVVPPGSAD